MSERNNMKVDREYQEQQKELKRISYEEIKARVKAGYLSDREIEELADELSDMICNAEHADRMNTEHPLKHFVEDDWIYGCLEREIPPNAEPVQLLNQLKNMR